MVFLELFCRPVGLTTQQQRNLAMDESVASAETIKANLELLTIFADNQRHYQSSTFNMMLLFVSANAGLCAAIELLAKALGAMPVGLLGLASVAISYFAAREPRRMWYISMKDGFKVQEMLKEIRVTLFADPFGSSIAKGGPRMTHAVHLAVIIFWAFYIQQNTSFVEMWHRLTRT